MHKNLTHALRDFLKICSNKRLLPFALEAFWKSSQIFSEFQKNLFFFQTRKNLTHGEMCEINAFLQFSYETFWNFPKYFLDFAFFFQMNDNLANSFLNFVKNNLK